MDIRVACMHQDLVDIDLLVENPHNPNKHDEKQIEILSKNIKLQGWRHPIIVSNRSKFVCAGHARLKAAKKLGCKTVPVDYQDFDSEAMEYAFMVADNKIAELANHDDNMMIDSLKELNMVDDFDFDLLGIPNFTFITDDIFDGLEETKKEAEKKYSIQIDFPNDMEMMDIHDDLLSRGYIVKVL